MTAVLLVSVYLFALACFLGLDVLARVPPNLQGVVLAGIGALAGVVGVGAWSEPSGVGLVGVGLAGAGAGAGLVFLFRAARSFRRPARGGHS